MSMPLTANQLDSLPPCVAAALPECPEPLAHGAEQRPRQRQEQRQRKAGVHRLAVSGRGSTAHKQRTLSDAQAIRRGAEASANGAGTSTPFWLEAGMRTAINRLCSVVLHAVGTGQLDLLHICEASADQLQAHFRIPSWQMSAVHRHVTTGIWLLTNEGTDGLPPDQVKEYGEMDATQVPQARSVADPQEWDLLPCCSHTDVPGEAGEVWPVATVPTSTDPYLGKKLSADTGSSRQRRSRRAWDPDAPMLYTYRESRKSRSRSGLTSKRSRRAHAASEHVKSRRRHRRAERRATEPMEIMWPINFQDYTFNPDEFGYVNGPPEPEHQQDLPLPDQHDQLLTLPIGQFVTSNGVAQVSRSEIPRIQADTQMMCCSGGSQGILGAEANTGAYSHRSTSSPTTGVWHDVSLATGTPIASRTSSKSSNGNSQLSGSEESPSLSTQKMPSPAAFSSTHTYVQTSSQNSGDLDRPEPTGGVPRNALYPIWSPAVHEPMSTAVASHQDQGQQDAFDPMMSYKVYHPRQDDDDVLQAEEDRRQPHSVVWANISSTEFNGTGDSTTANKFFQNFSPAAGAVADPLISAPPPPPPLQPPPLHLMQELPGVKAELLMPTSQSFTALTHPKVAQGPD